MNAIVIPKLQDFYREARMARQEGRMFMLLISQEDCPYCHLLKEEIIRPMLLAGDYKTVLWIRELLIDEGEMLRDLSGKWVSARDFAHRYDVFLTPTLLFLDPWGRELADKIVGVNTMEMYFYYVDQAIRQALDKLERAA